MKWLDVFLFELLSSSKLTIALPTVISQTFCLFGDCVDCWSDAEAFMLFLGIWKIFHSMLLYWHLIWVNSSKGIPWFSIHELFIGSGMESMADIHSLQYRKA